MAVYSSDFIRDRLIPLRNLPIDSFASNRAAVLVPLLLHNNAWHVLLTQRANTLRHHGGEVAFPGGMWEEGDQFPSGTALRESYEEIGLPQQPVTVLGMLDEEVTRHSVSVRPVVACIPDNLSLSLNDDEIAAVFTVPLSWFVTDKRLRTDIFTRDDGKQVCQHWVPAYQYKGYEIWGFTATVIVQLLSRCFSVNLTRKHKAPERIWT